MPSILLRSARDPIYHREERSLLRQPYAFCATSCYSQLQLTYALAESWALVSLARTAKRWASLSIFELIERGVIRLNRQYMIRSTATVSYQSVAHAQGEDVWLARHASIVTVCPV